jgi:hypothetical protein
LIYAIYGSFFYLGSFAIYWVSISMVDFGFLRGFDFGFGLCFFFFILQSTVLFYSFFFLDSMVDLCNLLDFFFLSGFFK